MKSRINLDIDHQGQAEIKIEHVYSEDIRDKTLSILMNQTNYADSYNKINTFREIPKGVFVVKERYEAMHSASLLGSCSDEKSDRVETYTLVPLNRIEFATTYHAEHPNDNPKFILEKDWKIQDQINEIKDLYRMLGLNSYGIDRLGLLINHVPNLNTTDDTIADYIGRIYPVGAQPLI